MMTRNVRSKSSVLLERNIRDSCLQAGLARTQRVSTLSSAPTDRAPLVRTTHASLATAGRALCEKKARTLVVSVRICRASIVNGSELTNKAGPFASENFICAPEPQRHFLENLLKFTEIPRILALRRIFSPHEPK